MAGVVTSAGYACLLVALHVLEPSQVGLTVQDQVRVDTAAGVAVELVGPGTTTLRLDAGTYVFRTTRDAQVILADASTVRVEAAPLVKDPTPDPPGLIHGAVPAVRGDSEPDVVPTLTVR